MKFIKFRINEPVWKNYFPNLQVRSASFVVLVGCNVKMCIMKRTGRISDQSQMALCHECLDCGGCHHRN